MRRHSKTLSMYDMDMECSLKGSIALYWYGLHTCIGVFFTQLSQIWGSVRGENVKNVKSYAHEKPEKVLKPLIYVCHGHGMQFERFYSLN
jgi:hypothetical protein